MEIVMVSGEGVGKSDKETAAFVCVFCRFYKDTGYSNSTFYQQNREEGKIKGRFTNTKRRHNTTN
jgi:hypothetical protein